MWAGLKRVDQRDVIIQLNKITITRLTKPVMAERGERKDVEKKPILDASVFKAFVAGVVAGNLNKGLLLGFLIGAVGGTYIQQNFAGVPDVMDVWRDFVERWRKTGGKR